VEPCSEAEHCFTLLGRPTYILGSQNPHFAVVGQALTNAARTTLIRCLGCTDAGITIDSAIEEIAPRAFHGNQMKSLTFAEPSRLRVIGKSAFLQCYLLSVIVIPSTVEVLGEGAFADCRLLQEVRFATGSRLRLLEKGAFDYCRCLGPIDVPAAADIQAYCTEIATAYDDDGSERVRLHFSVCPFRPQSMGTMLS
jgi:hypothetical protein